MANAFSMLPYLVKQQDPFSALLAGKLAAQKQQRDTLKWLATYQLQLQRMALSRRAADNASRMTDARISALNRRGAPGAGRAPAPEFPGINAGSQRLGLGPGMGAAPTPYAPGAVYDPFRPVPAVPGTTLGAPLPPMGVYGAPPPTPSPLNPYRQSRATPFDSPAGIDTGSLDAGLPQRLAALDEPPVDDTTEDDEPTNPFA